MTIPVGPKIPWKIIAALIATVILTVIAMYGGHTVVSWKEGYEQNQQRAQGQTATTGAIQDAGQASTEKAGDESAVTTAREDYNTQMTEAKKNDPVVRDRADRAIPSRVLQLARERRAARERAERDGQRGEAAGQGPSPPER